MNFQVGDIVEAFGVRGVVKDVNPSESQLIIVEFENGPSVACFFIDGRACAWHKKPSLKLAEKEADLERLNRQLAEAQAREWAALDVLRELFRDHLWKLDIKDRKPGDVFSRGWQLLK